MGSLRDLLNKQKQAAPVPAPAKEIPKQEPVAAAQPEKPKTGFAARMKSLPTIQPEFQAPLPTAKPAPVQAVATAKIPEEPQGVSLDTQKLRANLDYLASNIEQKEIVGQVVRTIAVQLRNAPELGSGLSDDDFNLIVRGLRRAFNIAARAKTEKREKRAAADKDVDEVSAMFKELGINL